MRYVRALRVERKSGEKCALRLSLRRHYSSGCLQQHFTFDRQSRKTCLEDACILGSINKFHIREHGMIVVKRALMAYTMYFPLVSTNIKASKLTLNH